MAGSARTHTGALPCPHCGGVQVHGHGSFRRKDGTRQQRFLCLPCGRTFNRLTDTPLAYLKKRDRWSLFLDGIVANWTLRYAAGHLNVHLTTAFRWRHRLLASLSSQPQPVLTGHVAATETFISYSEKGSRKTDGPGSHKQGRTRGRRTFRRFIDGKPSCVLLATDGKQHVVTTVGRGRPGVELLSAVWNQVVAAGTELIAGGLLAEACRQIGVQVQHPSPQEHGTLVAEVHRLSRLHTWLRRFRGVATRYLGHYLAWYRLVRLPAYQSTSAALNTIHTASHTPSLARHLS